MTDIDNIEPMEAAERIGEIDRQRKAIRARERELKDERKQLESILLNYFEQHGLQNIKKDNRTIYLHQRVTVKPKGGDYSEVVEALQQCGLDHLLRYNYNTMASLVREAEQDPDADLPDPLKEALEVGEVFSIRSRKA